MDLTERMEKYEKIYDDCERILGGEKWLDSFKLPPDPTPNNEQLESFNEYLKQFLNETDHGTIKTLLVVSKPFKNNEILSETISTLRNKIKTPI